ncbi:hypothetical protein [Intrasporangium sp. YIM S08009]|uniref:hypothetical protein n=1 Tax=Intrasporangium zincisolvens TaxID=3080018 RepID=UPI002B054B25|nr:hypothetical protein [Intrasporangium sp. YIM S08009]
MSIRVETADLPRTLGDYDYAFLVAQGPERPHVLAVHVTPGPEQDGVLVVDRVGSTATQIVSERPAVTLVFPPRDPSGRSLIVDGEVDGTGEGTLTVAPSGAVLHRPA